MEIDLKNLTITKAHEHLNHGDFSVKELAHEYLKIINKKNEEIHAFLEIFGDIDEQADALQKKFKEGSANILTGIPIALKDNILVKGRKVSAASKILENYTATYDSTVSVKLKEKGVLFMGRTNMDEFAMGTSTENSAFGVTKNPQDTTCVPGGSSGGSAASVAMGAVLGAFGSDTGGSVRQPASFCGCVGFKPTYGRVSRYGLIAMGSSLDQIGPISKNVMDSEILFNAISGRDSFDSTSLPDGFYPQKEVKKIKIGIPYELFEGAQKEILSNLEETVEKLKQIGYEITEVSLPNSKYSLASYYIIIPAEVSSNLARFDGVKYGLFKGGKNLIEDYLITRGEGFGKEVRRRIMLGTYVLSAGYYDSFYGKAQQARELIKADFRAAFENVDAILTPTTPGPAFKIGEKANDPLALYLEDIFTVPANIAGIPAISVPSGFTKKTPKPLPIGMQFSGAHGADDLLFRIGKEFLREV